jgi:hypothetical protein
MTHPGCWLAQFSNVPCDGRLVKAHLISKQRIKRELRGHDDLGYDGLDLVLWDRRVWVPACGGLSGLGGHHGALDGRILSVPRSALPEGLEAFAAEYGLTWSLDRDFGLREAAA